MQDTAQVLLDAKADVNLPPTNSAPFRVLEQMARAYSAVSKEPPFLVKFFSNASNGRTPLELAKFDDVGRSFERHGEHPINQLFDVNSLTAELLEERLAYPRISSKQQLVWGHLAARSWLGTAGNKQERAMFVAAFLGLSSWTILVTGYFFLLQAYALYLESILAGTALALALLETLQGAWSGSSFCDGLLEFALVFLSFVAAAGSAALLYSLWPA
ncbi:hypothetical protein AK812_SmicGene13525 [Symbiodinium microadriaticum]|uniref:Uncharacterized protein n=1 Tax=Symbiodinium microadriaticum TaxID=2951 RepID=A0A1Q9E7Y4_SYMMI|nr:hypothetical protein AK812_SmicGene13525 [Symbiodinium microadriaticum]